MLVLGVVSAIGVSVMLAGTARVPGGSPSRSGQRLVERGGREVPFPSDGHAPPGTMYLEFSAYTSPGVTFVFSRLRPFQDFTPSWPPPALPPRPEDVARWWERRVALPWASGARPWPDPAREESIHVKASGWPLRVLSCEIHGRDVGTPMTEHTHDYVVRGGVAFDNALRAGWADWPPVYPVVIPLRPLWPELIASVVLHGGAWWGFVVGIRALRRWRRVHRGACPACGYSRAGLEVRSACPECGGSG